MILLTGGCGYIGAHLARLLQKSNKEFVIMDFADDDVPMNSAELKKMGINIENGDCTKFDDVMSVMDRYPIHTVVHMASFKDVGESVGNPCGYFYNNINSTTTLLLAMKMKGVPKMLFSSSCSVYGKCEGGDETTPYNPESPYAYSKAICEQLIIHSGIEYVILRYFNPLGERFPFRDFSKDSLQNKMKQVPFEIYGNDYDTPDGSPVRDFIDIEDLVSAHLLALKWRNEIVNIGTGEPKSVLEIAKLNDVKYKFSARRPGDVAKVWADVKKFNALKKWTT